MRDWFKRRLESLLDNIIFAMGVAMIIAIWAAIKSLSAPWIIAISGGVFIMILVILRLFVFATKSYSSKLDNIPDIILKMHKRLIALELSMTPLLITEIVDSFLADLVELWGLTEAQNPELKQVTPFSSREVNREVMGVVLDRLKLKLENSEVEDVKLLLIRTGGLMNLKGKGISQVRDNDKKYVKLKSRLVELRPEILTELNTAVDDYLQFSFGLISLNHLVSSFPYEEITNGLPPKYSAEMGIWPEQVDRAMDALLADVRGAIQKQTHESRTEA